MPANARLDDGDRAPLTGPHAKQLGAEAFVFGFPLLMMAATMRLATNVLGPSGERAPQNQFAHLTRFPDPAYQAIVAANTNTLYSLAWFDLSVEPLILDLPDTAGRSYLMPLVDAWTDLIACFGPRSASAGHAYGIVGPGWTGTLPDGIRRIDASTNLARTICHLHGRDRGDLDSVQSIQQKLTLIPLSAYGTDYTPDAGIVDRTLPSGRSPHSVIMGMGAEEYLATLTAEMVDEPRDRDRSFLDRLATIQLRPGTRFDWAGLSEEIQEALEAGLAAGKRMIAEPPSTTAPRNGWRSLHEGLGAYGVDYLRRAQVANLSLGAPRSEDASFPIAMTDQHGDRTEGANHYKIRFEPGGLPPVNALWSLALYDSDQLVVANQINRYALGDRDELDLGPDGSLEISIQHDRPAGSGSNWLPAPDGDFNLMLHMYWPSERALDGGWAIPQIRRVY